MSGIIIILFSLAWLSIGSILLKPLIIKFFPRGNRLIFALVLTAWFFAPVIDEMAGAIYFKMACNALPTKDFLAPAKIGEGAFFDKSGTPKWRNNDELRLIVTKSKEWERIFKDSTQESSLARWPFQITQTQYKITERSTNRLVYSYYRLESHGGWIKRVTRFGVHAPYQCVSKGNFPREKDMITFN